MSVSVLRLEDGYPVLAVRLRRSVVTPSIGAFLLVVAQRPIVADTQIDWDAELYLQIAHF